MARCPICNRTIEVRKVSGGTREVLPGALVAVTPAEDGDEVVTRDGEAVRGVVTDRLEAAPVGSRLGLRVHRCERGAAALDVVAGIGGGLLLLSGVVLVLESHTGAGVAVLVAVLLAYAVGSAVEEWRAR